MVVSNVKAPEYGLISAARTGGQDKAIAQFRPLPDGHRDRYMY